MIAEYYCRVTDQDQLRQGPLGPYVDGFADLLFSKVTPDLSAAENSIARRLKSMATSASKLKSEL